LKITCTEEAIADVVDAITYLTSESDRRCKARRRHLGK